MYKKNVRYVSTLLLTTLLILGSVIPLSGQERPVARNKARRQVQLKNPEAAGLLLNLLARYAEGVPRNAQNEYDSAVAKALGDDAKVKQTVRRMLDRLKKTPETVRALPAEFRAFSTSSKSAARYRSAFSVAKKRTYTATPVAPAEPNIQIYYRGLRCIIETSDGSASDEPYLITSVVDVNKNVQTTKHPFGGVSYEDVDAGETPEGPEVMIYSGRAQDVAIIAVMMEYDFGDPDHFRDEIDAIVKAAAAAITLATGIPIPEEFTALLTEFFNWMTGSEDDLVGQDNRFFERSRLLGWNTSNLEDKEDIPVGGVDLEVNAAHRFHFRTTHRGDGGWYRAYYRVQQTP